MKKMKMRVISMMLVFILVFALAAINSTAETFEMNLSVNNETRIITVEGNAPAEWGKRTITVVALKPGYESINLDTATNEERTNAVAAVTVAACKSDGSFKIELPLGDSMPPAADEPPVQYTVVTGATGLRMNGTENKKSIKVYSATAVPDAISALKSAGSNMEQVIKDNAEILSLDLSGIFKTNADLVCSYMNTYYNEENSTAFDDISEIQKTYAFACLLTEITVAETAKKVELLEANADVLGVDTTDEEYVKAKNDTASCYASRLAEKMLPDRDNPSDFFDETVALTVLNKASREDVDGVLEKYKSIFDVSLDGDYAKLSAYEVAKALSGQNFLNAESVKAAFDSRVSTLIEELENEEEEDDEDSGSGSSSRGGGKMGLSSSLTATEPITPIEQKNDEMKFTDLENYSWAKEYIETLYKKEVIDGITETEYNPSGTVTREQLAKILSAAFGFDGAEETPFTDVEKGSWYAPYVAGAYKAEIVRGIAADKFGVAQPVSRQDLMVMLHRVLLNKGISVETREMDFADRNEIADYALTAVDALYAVGAVSGTELGEIEPSRYCNRAEAAKIVCAVMQYGEESAE